MIGSAFKKIEHGCISSNSIVRQQILHIIKYLEKCDDNVPPGAQGLLKYLDEVHEINGPDVPDRIKNPQPIQPIPDPVLPQFPSRPFPNPNYYLPIFIIPMIVVIILIPVGA